jgi:hypothetical protein
MSEYPVEVPASARLPKANYPTRPDDELIREIKQFIAETGAPYRWHGHTHTRPPQDANIVYRGEFDLPKSHSGPLNRAKWAPCPCCHPETAWYWKNGKIAWFPAEHVIRIVGNDCFKKINAAGHEQAIAQFRVEERARRDREFLLAHLRVVPDAVRVIEHAIPAIRDVDNARHVLSTRLKQIIEFDIWNDLRADGILKIHGQRTDTYEGPDGTDYSRLVGFIEAYGPLRGYSMLNPSAAPLRPKLERELAKLKANDFGDNFRARLDAMDDHERHRAANSLAKPIAAAKAIFAEADECRQFLSAESIATLNGWGREQRNSIRLYFKLEPGGLLVGRTEDRTQRMPLGSAFFAVFRELPRIGDIREV